MHNLILYHNYRNKNKISHFYRHLNDKLSSGSFHTIKQVISSSLFFYLYLHFRKPLPVGKKIILFKPIQRIFASPLEIFIPMRFPRFLYENKKNKNEKHSYLMQDKYFFDPGNGHGRQKALS